MEGVKTMSGVVGVNNTAAVLVLFILLVIITMTFAW